MRIAGWNTVEGLAAMDAVQIESGRVCVVMLGEAKRAGQGGKKPRSSERK